MEPINLEGTPKTPTIRFDATNGLIEIKGRSIPENSIEFYRPLINWLEQYSQRPAQNTEVKVQLEYFNTSSSKCLLDIFRRLEAVKKANGNVVIKWYYEEDDEDMREAGDDYESIIRIPFEMIELDDQ